MSDLRTTVDQLNQMILEGKTLEAFEKFYAEDVVMQDNDYPARVGKDVNRQYEVSFLLFGLPLATGRPVNIINGGYPNATKFILRLGDNKLERK